MRHSEVYERMPVQGWTASLMRNIRRTPREISAGYISGSKMESTKPTTAQGPHTEGEGEAEADLDSRSGGQDRAEGNGGSTERHLRAGLSQLLLWVPTGTRAAPGAGGSGSSHLYPIHGMDPGIRHHRVLRLDRERATHGDDRKANQR